jgi:hypothetical protein
VSVKDALLSDIYVEVVIEEFATINTVLSSRYYIHLPSFVSYVVSYDTIKHICDFELIVWLLRCLDD